MPAAKSTGSRVPKDSCFLKATDCPPVQGEEEQSLGVVCDCSARAEDDPETWETSFLPPRKIRR